MCQLHVPTTCASYVCVYQLHGNRMESNSRANIWKKRFPKTRSVKPFLLSLELKTPSRCLELRKPWAPSRGQSASQRSPSRSCSMCVCVWCCACPSEEVQDAVFLQPLAHPAHTNYHSMPGVTIQHSVTCVSPLKSTRLSLGVLIHYSDIGYLKGLVSSFVFQSSCFFFCSSSSSILWPTTYTVLIRES